MNEYRIDSDIVKHQGKILNIITVYKNNVIVSTAREDITSSVMQMTGEQKELKQEAI